VHLKLVHFASWTTALLEGATDDTDHPPAALLAMGGFPAQSKFGDSSKDIPRIELPICKQDDQKKATGKKSILKVKINGVGKMLAVLDEDSIDEFCIKNLNAGAEHFCCTVGDDPDFAIDPSLTFNDVQSLLQHSFLCITSKIASICFQKEVTMTYRNFESCFLQQATVGEVLEASKLSAYDIADDDFVIDRSLLFMDVVTSKSNILVNIVDRAE
jgi:hypothetical protein